jgi:uncharacterized protein (TIGR01777 family)
MLVAITGSSGLIGRALTRSLQDDGHTVRRVLRPGSGPSSPAPSPGAGSEGPVRWDPLKGEIDAAGLEGVDAVVHLAGAGVGDRRWSAARKREIRESRTRGTRLLAETLARLDRPPSVLVSASGVHFYGDRGDEVLTEASSPGGGFLGEEVVRPWEQATAPASEAGIRTVLARSGVVMSAHGGALPKLLRLFRLGLGGRMGSGRQWMSWITLADHVGAIRFLLEGGRSGRVAGPVNLTSPQPVTNRQLTAALGRALHRPILVPVPRFGPRLVVGRQMADEMLFMSQRVHPEVLQAAGYDFRHPDIDTALHAVLHEP